MILYVGAPPVFYFIKNIVDDGQKWREQKD